MTEFNAPQLPSGYELIVDQEAIDAVAAHAYLTRSYWAEGIALETVAKSIAHSLCVAVGFEGRQVAMARLVTDRATFAYLSDVYVLEEHRKRGLSKSMLAYLQNHPELGGLRFWALFTRDAQSLYAQFGWKEYQHPERFLLLDFPDAHQ